MSQQFKNKKFIFISLILFLIIGAFLFWNYSEKEVSATGEGWLSGWQYRKQIEAASGKSGTLNGDVSLSYSSKFNKAAKFDGTGDYVSFANSSDFDFGTGDFTIDTWVNFNDVSGEKTIIAATSNSGWILEKGDEGGTGLHLYDINASARYVYAPYSFSIGTWYHIAVVRSGSAIKFFVNGTQIGTDQTPYAGGYNSGGSGIVVGRTGAGGGQFNGYIDEVRISKGVARWTSNFTPSTSAYTADQYDVLLLHMDEKDQNTIVSSNLVSGQTDYQFKVDVPYNEKMKTDFSDIRFTSSDGSTQLNYWMEEKNRKTGTVNGNPVFGSTGKFGTSLTFDGTGDYVSIPDSADWDLGNVFSIDFWAYRNNTGMMAFFEQRVSDSDRTIAYYNNATNGIIFLNQVGGTIALYARSVGTISANEWHHIALIKTSSTFKIYVDGVAQEMVLDSGSYSATLAGQAAPLNIGLTNSVLDMNGKIDEFRISKGIARWTSNFTPSTSAYTADKYDVLLLHLDEASGYKTATSSNSLVDVGYVNGNPVLGSTGKFGTAITMDGSGDFISIPDSDDWYLGTGNFTIDFWVKFTSDTGDQAIVGQYVDTNNNWGVWFDGGARMRFLCNVGGATRAYFWGDFNPDVNTWYHIAVVRNGSSAYIFSNGSLLTLTTATAFGTNEIGNFATDLKIGAWTGYNLNGQLDELRISKGTARWTSSFTLPTSAYTADQYTKLLLHFNDQVSSGVVINETIIPFWVKASSLSANNTVYLYYGNASAVSASNGDNTFEFFDDFNSGLSPNTSKWNIIEGTWTIDNQQLDQSATTDRFLQIATNYTGTNYVVESNIQYLDEYNNNLGALVLVRSNPAVYANAYFGGIYRVYNSGVKEFMLYTSSANHIAGSVSFGTWYKTKVIANGDNISLYINNNLIGSGTSSLYPSGYAGLAAQAVHARFDNFFVRKYPSSDPMIALGSEETTTTSITSVSISTSDADVCKTESERIVCRSGQPITFNSVASGNLSIKLYVCKDLSCTNCGPSNQSNCWAYSTSAASSNPVAIYNSSCYAGSCGTGECEYTGIPNQYWAKTCDTNSVCSDIIDFYNVIVQ